MVSGLPSATGETRPRFLTGKVTPSILWHNSLERSVGIRTIRCVYQRWNASMMDQVVVKSVEAPSSRNEQVGVSEDRHLATSLCDPLNN